VSDAELQLLHPPRRCGDGSHCSGKIIEARFCEVALPTCTFGVFLPGAVYECKPCMWWCAEPLKDATAKVSGWTCSVSPCRRATDVQPR